MVLFDGEVVEVFEADALEAGGVGDDGDFELEPPAEVVAAFDDEGPADDALEEVGGALELAGREEAIVEAGRDDEAPPDVLGPFEEDTAEEGLAEEVGATEEALLEDGAPDVAFEDVAAVELAGREEDTVDTGREDEAPPEELGTFEDDAVAEDAFELDACSETLFSLGT